MRSWRRRFRKWRQRLTPVPPQRDTYSPWEPVRERKPPRLAVSSHLWLRQAAIALAAFAFLAAVGRLPVAAEHPARRVVAYVAEADYDPVAWYESGRAREVMGRYLSSETWKRLLRGQQEVPVPAPQNAVWPVQGDMTSGFGWRQNPATGKDEFHEGIDIAAPEGTPLVAVLSGTVKSIRESPAYGKVVELDHGQGLASVYAHCREVLVREKQRVAVGEQVATVGKTGNAKVPHLHLELRLDGKPVDPTSYLPKASP